MRKVIFMVLTILLIATTVTCASDDIIKVVVDGKVLTFDVPPIVIQDRIMVPMIDIFEELGATVEWNESTQTVLGRKDFTIVTLEVDNDIAQVNGIDIELDVPAKVVDDRTMVPVRFISDSLSKEIIWDDRNKTVFINSLQAQKVIMPDLVGMTKDHAKRAIETAGLKIGSIKAVTNDQVMNAVLGQSIAAGTEVDKDTPIDFTVSGGQSGDPKSQVLTINLPQDKKTIKVTVKVNDIVVYDKVHNREDSPVDVEIKGKGNVTMQVLFDDVVKHTEILDFN